MPIDDRLVPQLVLRHRLKLVDDVAVCRIGRLTGSHKSTVERAIKGARVKRWLKLFQTFRASYDMSSGPMAFRQILQAR